MSCVTSSKQSLRETALSRRLQMTEAERAAANRAILDNFLSAVRPPPDSVIAGYWPVRGEADARPILLEMIRRGHRAALPQVAEPRRPLVFRAWDENAPMIPGRYGIPAPDPAACPAVTPGIVLTPMLAFDGEGHRLGYGSGYYDRTFAALPGVMIVGIAFEAQKLAHVPRDPYDAPMTLLITEKTVHRFRGGA